MSRDLTIVCFMGGACGDIVTAVIDATNTTVDIDGRIILSKERVKLKDLNNFNNDKEKDLMIEKVEYKSISSHDYQYHLINQHTILYVGIFDMDLAIWAADRFKKLHPGTWAQFNNHPLEEYAEKYIKHTHMVMNNKCVRILDIKDIINGKLINKLTEFGFEISNATESLYINWLKANNLVGGKN